MHIPISVWSDIACPWCFVGKAHLEQAMQQLKLDAPEIELSVRWRAFELDPTPRTPSTLSYAERLAKKYQRSIDEAHQMLEKMTQAISDAGGDADFAKVIAANTFDAHRLIQWAGETDQKNLTSQAQHRLNDSFMRGYLGEGLNLNHHADMLTVIGELELDVTEAADVLASNRYGEVVRADEQEAQANTIRGVPFFVIGDYGLSGAQPSDALIKVIQQVNAIP